jgi:hypothetical protein
MLAAQTEFRGGGLWLGRKIALGARRFLLASGFAIEIKQNSAIISP